MVLWSAVLVCEYRYLLDCLPDGYQCLSNNLYRLNKHDKPNSKMSARWLSGQLYYYASTGISWITCQMATGAYLIICTD
jgi:hypothetical protein